MTIAMNEFKINALKMLKQPQQTLVQAWFKTHSATGERFFSWLKELSY